MDHKKLRKIRIKKDWTQGFASKQIGIQQSYLSKLENGQAIPSTEIIEAIAKAYSIDKNSFAADLTVETTHSNKPQPATSNLVPMGLAILGFLFIGTAWFGIYKSNYAYTYELAIQEQQTITAPMYFILDEYHGEKHQREFSDIQYTYHLIGERKIHPKQNRWIYYLGFIFTGMALISYFFPLGRMKI